MIRSEVGGGLCTGVLSRGRGVSVPGFYREIRGGSRGGPGGSGGGPLYRGSIERSGGGVSCTGVLSRDPGGSWGGPGGSRGGPRGVPCTGVLSRGFEGGSPVPGFYREIRGGPGGVRGGPGGVPGGSPVPGFYREIWRGVPCTGVLSRDFRRPPAVLYDFLTATASARLFRGLCGSKRLFPRSGHRRW